MNPQGESLKDRRAAAIAEAVEAIRGAAEARGGLGVNPESLEEMAGILRGLGARTELFPPEDFPFYLDEGGQNPVYRLSEGTRHDFALYMVISEGPKKVPPHSHTTWALIAGVRGEEENFFYTLADGDSLPELPTGSGHARILPRGGHAQPDKPVRLGDGQAQPDRLVRLGENSHRTVKPGDCIGMMPGEIHHIENRGDSHTLHLHMYGTALDHLHHRPVFDPEAGTWSVIPPDGNIRDPD